MLWRSRKPNKGRENDLRVLRGGLYDDVTIEEDLNKVWEGLPLHLQDVMAQPGGTSYTPLPITSPPSSKYQIRQILPPCCVEITSDAFLSAIPPDWFLPDPVPGAAQVVR